MLFRSVRMTEWSIHIDPWTAEACDLAIKMHAIEWAFRNERGFKKYHAGLGLDKDIALEYDSGTLDLWLQEIDDEDVPRMLCILAPLSIAITEAESSDGFRRTFDRYDATDLVRNRPFDEMVRRAKLGAKPDEVANFADAWDWFKESIGYNDYDPEAD